MRSCFLCGLAWLAPAASVAVAHEVEQTQPFSTTKVEIQLVEPRPARAGEAGIDRFEPDMSRIRSRRGPDGVLVIDLGGEGMEHMELVIDDQGRPQARCATAVPARDFREASIRAAGASHVLR